MYEMKIISRTHDFVFQNEARALVRKIFDDNDIDFGRSERTVRVNATVSGLCEEDLKSVLSAKQLPTTIHLPKVDNLDDVKYVSL